MLAVRAFRFVGGTSVTKADLQLVTALRKLTDLPWSMCRQAVVEAGGDVSEVVRLLRRGPCCGLHVSDAELAAVLAAHGVAWVPPEHTPRPVSEAEVIAGLTAAGLAVTDHFLLGEALCFVTPGGQLMAHIIEDDDLSAATKAYLRRVGAPEYGSFDEYRAAHPD
jgi:hypothetical protein